MKRFWIVILLLAGLVPGAAAQQDDKTLTIEEYELVAAAEDTPTHFEFRDRVTEDMLALRQEWREPDPAVRIEAINAIINQAGYQLAALPDQEQTGIAYELYYHEAVLIPDIAYVWPIAVSDSGQDFALLVDTMSTPTLMITPETVGEMGMDFVYVAPVFVGEDLYTAAGDWQANTFTVSRNGTVIYTVAPDQPTVEPPIKTLGSWDGHWVLEADGDLIIDGESQKEKRGCDEIFGWRLIAGQPFYFFAADGKVQMSYAGEVLPDTYDAVSHGLCCEASMFNVSGNDSMIWFFAERDGLWYYVEAGLYE